MRGIGIAVIVFSYLYLLICGQRCFLLGAVAESVERGPCVRKIDSFGSRPSKSDDLQIVYLLLPSPALSII